MAIANLHETWLTYKSRVNTLNLEISMLQTQKQLATYSQADVQGLLSSEKHSQRDYFKSLWEADPELQAQYRDYTEIPDFEDAIDKITAQYQDQLNELVAWETMLDAQITTDDTEKQECQAYMDSIKQMLSSQLQEDFSFSGLGQ